MKFSFQPLISNEHLPLTPKMKGSNLISSDSSDINEDNVFIRDLSYHVKQELDNVHVLFASYYREDRFKVLKGFLT
jgi:hypothetical protein